jgi:hypothetical protein
MRHQILSCAKDYRPRISEVEQLFSTVFRRPFPIAEWTQWYLNNPYGDPHVVLGYHAGQLVGHHALIPQELVGERGETFRCLLSVSTMVHPSHRGLSGFLQMVDMLHEASREVEAAFILAFPNSSSAPLFTKLYGYKLLKQTDLCHWRPGAFTVAPGGRVHGVREARNTPQYSYPASSLYWNWRTQANHARRFSVGKTLQLVYKVIEPATFMLLDVKGTEGPDAAECLARCAQGLGLTDVRLTRYHAALLGIEDGDLAPHDGYVIRFLGFPLAEEIPEIRFSLLLSDVF